MKKSEVYRLGLCEAKCDHGQIDDNGQILCRAENKPGLPKDECIVIDEVHERWKQELRGQGYKAEVCWGFDEAKDIILNYLEGKK